MKTSLADINSKPNWIFLSLIGVLFPLVYYHLFFAGFIAWDDPEYIINNRDVHHFSIVNFFTKFYIGNYHPLTMFNYALDWKLFGKNSLGYHLENILWHFINTILVFYLGKKIKLSSLQSFLLAAVFAFHPTQLETVAWIAERKNLLSAFFFLGGLFYYFEYKNAKALKYLIIVFLFFIAALLSKPSAVVFPLALVLIDYFIYKEALKTNYKRYALFFLLSIAVGIITLVAQEEAKFLINPHHYSLLNKVGVFGYGLFHYVSKFLLPIKLSAFYSYPDNLTSTTAIGLISLLIMGVLFFYLIKKKQHLLLFGWLFFITTIFIVLQIIPFGDAIAADRYMYIPIIGLTLGIIYFFNRYRLNKLIVMLILVVLCGMSFTRAALWKDSLPLFLNVLKTNSTSFIAINSLGVEYMERGDFYKSYKYFNKVIQLYPSYYKGYYNRGLLNGKTQNYNHAIADFSKAIQYKNYYKAYVGRANVYYILKDFSKAIADAEMVLKLNANNVKANFILANCYDDLNQLDKALLYYNKAIQLNEEDATYYLRRAILYGKLQQFSVCLKDLETAISINPNYAEAYYWKAVVKINLKQNPCADLKKAENFGYALARPALDKYCKN